ncbi:hypothetical protein OPU71_18520 [Niveibacterium sp. 24ML]|nr:hypothetical protein [Niveibacterium sp. 24ML]MCX9158121.1 hypothetical protein [Niveibacterium sp. 24ML]
MTPYLWTLVGCGAVLYVIGSIALYQLEKARPYYDDYEERQ